jgi:curved DNA-binding protein CbpA
VPPHSPDFLGEEGHDVCILLNEAYAVLSDPDARAKYNATLEQTLVDYEDDYTGNNEVDAPSTLGVWWQWGTARGGRGNAGQDLGVRQGGDWPRLLKLYRSCSLLPTQA